LRRGGVRALVVGGVPIPDLAAIRLAPEVGETKRESSERGRLARASLPSPLAAVHAPF
jgi:hypothetical protein